MATVTIITKTGHRLNHETALTADDYFKSVTELVARSAHTGERFITGPNLFVAVDRIECLEVID